MRLTRERRMLAKELEVGEKQIANTTFQVARMNGHKHI